MMGWWSGLCLRLSTAIELVRLFVRRGRYTLVPLVLILLLGAILLGLSELFPAFAPFVYTVI